MEPFLVKLLPDIVSTIGVSEWYPEIAYRLAHIEGIITLEVRRGHKAPEEG
jgi:hypothetical protein